MLVTGNNQSTQPVDKEKVPEHKGNPGHTESNQDMFTLRVQKVVFPENSAEFKVKRRRASIVFPVEEEKKKQ